MKIPDKRVSGFQSYNELGQEFKVGFEGEKVAYDFFKGIEGLNVTWSKNTIETWDLIINNKWIDIKTIDADYKKCLLIPVFQGVKNDFYVGVKLPNLILGYLSADQAKQLPIENFGFCYARWKYITELNPINELIYILKEVGNE